MQQHSSAGLKSLIAALKSTSSLAPGLNQGVSPAPHNPITGIYGSGKIVFLTSTSSFVVPANCTKLRVRGWSQGGGRTQNGGSVSFGVHCSATGGQSGQSVSGLGGSASGGDINHAGAPRNSSRTRSGTPAANLFGPGAIVGGYGADGGYASGDAGLTGEGGRTGGAYDGENGQPGLFNILDFIGTGGGGACPPNGGGYRGSNGGGGGGGVNNAPGGDGGFPGGGRGGDGGSFSGAVFAAGSGAFFLKEISGLVPGSTIAVTIPAANDGGGGGLIIVEY